MTELAEFMRLIRMRETSDDLELARQVVTLAEAAESSLANGGAPVAVSSSYENSLLLIAAQEPLVSQSSQAMS